MEKPDLNQVAIEYSRGRGKYGKQFAYIRPASRCLNRSGWVGGFNKEELDEAILKRIRKYYYPISFYIINDIIIGSNSEKNA